MNIIEVEIDKIIPYDNNPRKNDEAVDKVALSISAFGFKVPIVIDANNVVVTGHTRLKAAKKLGMNIIPCIKADDLTDEQIKVFRLVDNKTAEFAEWDFKKLEQELEQLNSMELDFKMSDFGFDDILEEIEEPSDVEHSTLTDKFIVPPFSILDTRQGYWQDRKKAWKDLGLKSDLGRNGNLSNAQDKSEYMKTGCKGVAVQTSIFDPVLAEIMYKWFCVDGGNIYDCFAGGSVRGIVADKLGYKYTGIDIRQEQVDANYENASDLGLTPVWYCDDSKNADKYIQDNSVDMIFSCPPYADLEVYSDNPNDISNMEYDDFCKAYKEIIDVACRKLKDNRFAAFVVGDVRDKKGAYRDFVDYTKKCFLDNGLKTYNELILVEQSGTGALRAKKQFGSLRKVIKTHQNVLVFYKGDIKKIKDNYTEISVDDLGDELDG